MAFEINLTPEECKQSIDFGNEILKKNAQSKRDFGSGKIREANDNLVDIIEGKLAEVGFSKFFNSKTGKELILDFKVYPDNMTIDYGQDIDAVRSGGSKYLSKCRVDIKATRVYSKWLLVEGHKFWADAYVLVKVNVPSDSESEYQKFLDFISKNGVLITITGFAYHFDLIDNDTKEPFFLFKQGEKLFKPDNLYKITEWNPGKIREYIKANKASFPDMFVTLKSPLNYGLPISKLRASEIEWAEFFKWVSDSLKKI